MNNWSIYLTYLCIIVIFLEFRLIYLSKISCGCYILEKLARFCRTPDLKQLVNICHKLNVLRRKERYYIRSSSLANGHLVLQHSHSTVQRDDYPELMSLPP